MSQESCEESGQVSMKTCVECGRRYDYFKSSATNTAFQNSVTGNQAKYCSKGCLRKAEEAKASAKAQKQEAKAARQARNAASKAERKADQEAAAEALTELVVAANETKVGGLLFSTYGQMLRFSLMMFPVVGPFLLVGSHTDEMPWTKTRFFTAKYVLFLPLTAYYEYKRFIFLTNRKMGLE